MSAIKVPLSTVTPPSHEGFDGFKEGLSLLGPLGGDVAGPTPVAGVSRQSELADGEDAAAHIAHGSIGHPILIVEDAEPDALVSDISGVLLRVPHLHTDQDHKAFIDGRGELASD